MRQWIAGMCLCFAWIAGYAQNDEASQADALYSQHKRIDALPLYEDLVKSYPKEWIYFERLADCLGAASKQTTDPAEVKALRTRARDTAKHAIELGDPNFLAKIFAGLNPDEVKDSSAATPAAALLHEGEKAYTAGDFKSALAKYEEAADADPQLYEAPLYAGDTGYALKDLKLAEKWFARAVAVNPDRETAYRYWDDALWRLGNDPFAGKAKFIDAIVAEPYSNLAWQGLKQWAQRQQAVLLAPKIDRPGGPVVDANKPINIPINIDAAATDDKKHPGASGWLMDSLIRAGYRGDEFKKDFPNEKEYRHSLREESTALKSVAESVKNKNIKKGKLDESLRNLGDVDEAGMLDFWILISAADKGIVQDYAAYRADHRKLLHDSLDKFVVHGGLAQVQ